MRVIKRGDVGMPQLADQVDFVLKIRGPRIGAPVEHLERFAALLGVMNRLVDDSKTALIHAFDDRVLADARKVISGFSAEQGPA